MFDVNVNNFAQQIQIVQKRLERLYRGPNFSVGQQPELLPLALKELGLFSEELQIAVEELQQQNAELAETRIALETERQHYHELFEFAPDGYVITDTAGTIKEANRAASGLLNVPQRFIVGKPLLIFIAEDERQAFHNQLLQLQTLEQVKNWMLSLTPRDSQPFTASVTARVVHDLQGQAVGFRLCIRDNSLELRLDKRTKSEATNNSDSSQEDLKKK